MFNDFIKIDLNQNMSQKTVSKNSTPMEQLNRKREEVLEDLNKSLPLPNPSLDNIGKVFSVWKGSENVVSTPKPSSSTLLSTQHKKRKNK